MIKSSTAEVSTAEILKPCTSDLVPFALRQKIVQGIYTNFSEEPIEKIIQGQIWGVLGSDHEDLHLSLMEEFEGNGPIKPLLEDPDVTEILIGGWDQIHYEKNGMLTLSRGKFTSPRTLDRFLRRLLTEMDRVADQRHPMVDGTLQNGTRVHIALPPVVQYPVISLRRHSHFRRNLDTLAEQGMMSPEVLAKLKIQIEARANILVCGPTGSGKTTLLRALINSVDPSQRILVVEDTSELGLKRTNSVSLLSRMCLNELVPNITLQDLVKNALRMRPDRLVVGEIRSEEAMVFLDAVSTGHSGSMSSIHGSSAMQALSRLEHLVSRGSPHWSTETIRKLIYESVDLVICVARKKEGRAISEIAELSGLESFGFLIESWSL